MPFLVLKDGVVTPTEEGKEIPQVKALYNADKTEGKKFFYDCLRYIYYVYKRDGVYQSMFLTYRKSTVCERHVSKRSWEELEKNQRVKDLIEEYLNLQMTQTERLGFNLEQEIEKLLSYIASIEYRKPAKVKVPHKDKETGETIYVEAEITIDNSKEKLDALKNASNTIDYSKKLKEKIVQEDIEKRKKVGTRRLFDQAKK